MVLIRNQVEFAMHAKVHVEAFNAGRTDATRFVEAVAGDCAALVAFQNLSEPDKLALNTLFGGPPILLK